jgi:hypothetical protein
MVIALAMVIGMVVVMVMVLAYLAFAGSRKLGEMQERLGIAEACAAALQDRINRERDTHRIAHADLDRDLQATKTQHATTEQKRADRVNEIEQRLTSIAEEHEKLTVAFQDVKSRVGALQMSKR